MKQPLEILLNNPQKTMTSIIRRVATGPELSKSISYDEARAGMRLVLEGKAELARHSGFDSALLLRGTEGGVTPSLRKKNEFVRFWEQGKDTVFEAGPNEIGIEQENRLVPIPEELQPDKEGDFAPDEKNQEIAKLAAEEGLAALEGKQSPTGDALLFSASLMLWHLGRYASVAEAAVTVRKILSGGKAARRFRRAA